MISINCPSLIEVPAAVFEKIPNLFWEPIWRAPVFGAGISQCDVTEKLLITEYK
jgi:hypothetical protein